MNFDQKYFKKFQFALEDIRRYFASAMHDLDIAQKDSFPEVKFTYSYQALIKAGITLLAKIGKVKVRSIPGHHVNIFEAMGDILGDQDVTSVGNAMRMKRNADLYGGGELIGEKEAADYLKFVQGVIEKVKGTVSQ